MRRRYLRGSANSKKEDAPKSIISDATLVLACITGFGYWVAFSYEKGYKSYYELNEIFITDIGIKEILISITAISTLLLVIQQATYIYKQLTPNKSVNPIVSAFRYKFVPIAFLLFIAALIIPGSVHNLIYLVIAWILIAIWLFLFIPYVYHWKVKGYKNKMALSVSKIDTTPLIERTKNIYNMNKPAFILLIILLVFLSSNIASLYGVRQASNEENYLVIHQHNHDYAVLDNNDGNYILAPLNIKKAIIKPNFLIIEGKSNFTKPIIFKSMYFKDGLKVKR
ncbi:hypothetical protein QF028_003343 [Neobacillus sp. B4I6]|uniref:hypothetical protein n=1 Tax=Neobacillus sp. B4I6 TaxID=3373925 RepID=UPI003D1ECCBA